jgi:hypothetical protein
LIQSSVALNTIVAYRKATQKLEAWLDGQVLTDALLAAYITDLYHQGKSPATIAQVVAAVKWRAGKSHIEVVGEVTQRTLAGIRREGKTRGQGHSLVRGGSGLRVCRSYNRHFHLCVSMYLRKVLDYKSNRSCHEKL